MKMTKTHRDETNFELKPKKSETSKEILKKYVWFLAFVELVKTNTYSKTNGLANSV